MVSLSVDFAYREKGGRLDGGEHCGVAVLVVRVEKSFHVEISIQVTFLGSVATLPLSCVTT